jgi:hypothetical protein
MRIRKRPGVLTSVLLLLAIFANCAMAGTCLCGQACVHGLSIKTQVNSGSFIHFRCFGTACKSCTLEKGQAFKGPIPAAPIVNVQILDTPFIVSTFLDYHCINHLADGFVSFCAYASCLCSTIYLKNRSLLC